ncbi:hypothetical protein [Cronobacter phage vB_Cdu_VP8]|nr:hypothetical protein [Cronobacter phage vB_Cdu_VP8]
MAEMPSPSGTVSRLASLYMNKIDLLRFHMQAGLAAPLARMVIRNLEEKAPYVSFDDNVFTLTRSTIVKEIYRQGVDRIDPIYKMDNDVESEVIVCVEQLDIALNIINDEIIKEALKLGWPIHAVPGPLEYLTAMTGSQRQSNKMKEISYKISRP